MEQREIRMPATGEGWRHYRGGYKSLYTVIGMAVDAESGEPIVVYTEYGWSLIQLPPIYARKLSSFLQVIDTGYDEAKATRGDDGNRFTPRFKFEREAGGDKSCPYINPVTGTGWRKLALDDVDFGPRPPDENQK